MRVLLLDEGFASGALAAFGLYRAGCVVDVIAAVGGNAQCKATGGVWRFGPRPGAAFVDDVVAQARTGEYDVIYPATEPLQRLFWPCRHSLPALRLPTDDATAPDAFLDKRRMSELAERAGVATPSEVALRSASDVQDAARTLGFPFVVKGAVGRGGQTTFIVSSRRAAHRAVRAIDARAVAPFAQRYIDGATYLVGGVFDRGKSVRLYAGEKRVQFPRRTGPAAVLVSTHEPELVAAASRVFGEARVTGIASADFVRDADGRFHFLELNPRPWGSLAAARDAGVDLFGPLVALWSGTEVETQLDWREHVRSPVFPLALPRVSAWLSGDAWRSLARAARDSAVLGPALTAHLIRRAVRVAQNW